MLPQNSPSLYGIGSENSARSGDDLWGKNQFNSTFPLSLCLYMRDHDINPVTLRLIDGLIDSDDSIWDMSDIVGDIDEEPFFSFETTFEPYRKYSRNDVDNIDLVVSVRNVQIRPFEIKLTVVPDSGTSEFENEKWAPEIVMRPVSSAHAMMGIAHSLSSSDEKSRKNDVVDALKPAYNKVTDWNNRSELLRHADVLHESLQDALTICEEIQRPFLLQPIWRTEGQSLTLADQCFDVFVWSDVAVVAVPILEYDPETDSSMTRTFRELARHVRSLYDVLTTGDHDYLGIYKGMSQGLQTDKSFALGGKKTIKYLQHQRLRSPSLPRETLNELILDGGEAELKPERRFDAAVQAHMINRSAPS